MLWVAYRIADVNGGHARNGHKVARTRNLNLGTLKPLKCVELYNFRLGDGVGILSAKNHLLADLKLVLLYPSDTDTADIFVVINVGNESFERSLAIAVGGGNFL